jgi:predicted phage terminase large subunit-like protein
LLDCWAEKVEFPELKKVAQQQFDKWKPHVVYVEDKASGQSLIQELKRETRIPIRAVKVDRDKYARACAVSPIVESGKVFVPKNERWVMRFIDEMAAFPQGSYDDIVDSTSQALDRLSHYTRTLDTWRSGGGNVVPINQAMAGVFQV